MPPAPASAAPSGAAVVAPTAFDPARDAGPEVARALQVAFALVLLCAWASLGSQVLLLVGERGLLPASELLDRARALQLGVLELPTLFWLGHADALLLAGTYVGGALALFMLLGRRPQLCLLLSAPLYLSYAAIGQDFLQFQWDNLLVEGALLLACLSPRAPSPLAFFLLRALLFKLYFESGIAKWQSHLHDWHDGSAMTYYFETAPLPAALAFHAHHLPRRLLELASWGALLLELPLPLLIFGPRAARLGAFFAFTAFQIVNTATANYGFFTYMSCALHLVLLSDADVLRLRRGRPALGAAPVTAPAARPLLSGLARLGAAAWIAASLAGATIAFGGAAAPAALA